MTEKVVVLSERRRQKENWGVGSKVSLAPAPGFESLDLDDAIIDLSELDVSSDDMSEYIVIQINDEEDKGTE